MQHPHRSLRLVLTKIKFAIARLSYVVGYALETRASSTRYAQRNRRTKLSTFNNPNMQLKNKVALIVGINNDIGRTTAIAMAQQGAKIAIADRDLVRGEAIVAKIINGGGEAFFHELNIVLEREVKNMVECVVAKYGSLDIAFNNASVESELFPLARQPESLVAQLIDFNLNGTWMCIKHEIRQMLEQNGGAIVNNVGIYRTDGRMGCAIYRATKSAIRAITESAAVEYARHNIRVNAIAPGILQQATIFAQGIDNNNVRPVNSFVVPMGRGGQFEEVADTMVWLCSDNASFVTGHILPIDGGLKALSMQ